MVIDQMPNMQLHSNKGEIPFVYTYLALLISSTLIFILLININFPKVDYSSSFYSCFLNSFEGKIECKFPNKLSINSNGMILYVNGKKFDSPVDVNVKCSSNSFEINKGMIKCGKMS